MVKIVISRSFQRGYVNTDAMFLHKMFFAPVIIEKLKKG